MKNLSKFFYYIPKSHSTAELLAEWDDRNKYYTSSLSWKTKEVKLPPKPSYMKPGVWGFAEGIIRMMMI